MRAFSAFRVCLSFIHALLSRGVQHMEIEADDISAYGCSLIGIPVLNIAFGKKGGWAHTVNSQTACEIVFAAVAAAAAVHTSTSTTVHTSTSTTMPGPRLFPGTSFLMFCL